METSESPTVVITRARSQSHDFESALKGMGLKTFSFPTIEIKTRPAGPENKERIDKIKSGFYDWIVFTSSNGVTSLAEIAGEFDLPHKTKIAVIGDKTSQVFQTVFKREPELKPKKFISESLVEEFKNQEIDRSKVLIVTASKSREVVRESLWSEGAEVDELIAYDNIDLNVENAAVTALSKIEHLIFTFFSPSAVNSTCSNLGERIDLLKRAKIVSIGPITTKALLDKGLKVAYESPDHSEQGVLTIINKYVSLGGND